jgi:hypothetical protein
MFYLIFKKVLPVLIGNVSFGWDRVSKKKEYKKIELNGVQIGCADL